MEKRFIFSGYELNTTSDTLTFRYKITSEQETIEFAETITLLTKPVDFVHIPSTLLEHLLDNLHLILGISYWKLFCPKIIETPGIVLIKEQADFWNTVYTKGLGEFFYSNKIDFQNLVQFPYQTEKIKQTVSYPRKDRSLLLLGGGKDSIVAGELLEKSNKSFTACIVNGQPFQEEIAHLLNTKTILIKRQIDPKLLEMNAKQGVFNGHVPVSAIYGFVSLLIAALYDYRFIVSSNERSANYGNVAYLGQQINHQWSKSLEFEGLFSEYVKNFVTPDIEYFSLLRPLHELKIAQLFTNYPHYFSLFASCNTNFKIHQKTDKKWCGQCPKCAFVFALLAAYLPKDKVIAIFGKNLFADEALVGTYQQLLGIKDSKPFECVGTPEETKLAFYLAYKRGEFHSDTAMQMFMKEVLLAISNINELEKEVLAVSTEHHIPQEFVNVIPAQAGI